MKLLIDNKRIIKVVFIAIFALFLWVSLFGIFHYMGEMLEGGVMGNCIFNGQMNDCTMNLSDHVAFWKGLLKDGPKLMGLSGILSLILIAGLSAFFKKYYLDKFFERTLIYYSFLKKLNPLLPLFNFFRKLFSQGILNPKLY